MALSPAEDTCHRLWSLVTPWVLVRQVVVLLRWLLLPLRPWRVVVVAPAAAAASTAPAALAYLPDLLKLPAALSGVSVPVVEDAKGVVVLLLDLASRGLERLLVI